MKFAYADPPYPGQSKKHYGDHRDYAGEVDHPALIERLVAEFPDGWALSTDQGSLRGLLPLCPEKTRVMAWVKPFASIKKNVYPTYAWEPVILHGGRNAFGDRHKMVRDWMAAMPPVFVGKSLDATAGQKPDEFCLWLFDCFGAEPTDELHDLFPGSGAVGAAWERFCAAPRFDFPSVPEQDELGSAA